MKTLMVLSALTSILSGTAFADQMTCDMSRYKVCVESVTTDISEDCASRGGVLGEQPCATANRIGSCAVSDGDNTVYVRYYRGFMMNPEKNCKDNKGTYVPG